MLTASFVINRSVKLKEGFETSDLRREFVPICLVKTKPLFFRRAVQKMWKCEIYEDKFRTKINQPIHTTLNSFKNPKTKISIFCRNDIFSLNR